MEDVQVLIRLPRDMKDWLFEEARKKTISVSGYIRLLLLEKMGEKDGRSAIRSGS